jgi:hypothetical protein
LVAQGVESAVNQRGQMIGAVGLHPGAERNGQCSPRGRGLDSKFARAGCPRCLLGDQQTGPRDELGCLAQPEVGAMAAAVVDDDLANRVRPLLEITERAGPVEDLNAARMQSQRPGRSSTGRDALSTIRTPTPLACRSHASVSPVGPAGR